MPILVSFKEHCPLLVESSSVFLCFSIDWDNELKLECDCQTTVFLVQLFCHVLSVLSLLALFLSYFHSTTLLLKLTTRKYKTTCHAFIEGAALHLKCVILSWHQIKYSFVSWLPKTESQMFTMGIISETYHSSS